MKYNSRYNKTIITVLLCLVFIGLFTSAVSAEKIIEKDNKNIDYESSGLLSSNLLSTNDGYLEDSREAVRIVDFRTAATDVPSKSKVESELIIANYGKSEVTDIKLRPYITDSDGNELSSDKYQITPKEVYESISLEPGSHKIYNFKIRFEEENKNYTVSFVDDTEPASRPLASKKINVQSEGSQIDEPLVLDRRRANSDFISVTRFKDENVRDTNTPGSYISIPPVELDSDGNIENIDVANGNIIDFGNIRENTDSYGVIESSDGDINVGFSSENVPSQEYYSLSTSYRLNNINSVEIAIVDSVGNEIDENTTYYLTDEDSLETRNFHLSSKEANFIRDQQESYIEFKNVDSTSNDIAIELYEMKTVAMDEIWNLPSHDLTAELSTEATDPQPGENIKITASITNEGSAVYNNDVRLYENLISTVNSTVGISDNIIVNPGDTEQVTYSVLVETEGTYEFKLIDDRLNLNVASPETNNPLYADISSNKDAVVVGNEIQLEVSDLSAEDISRVDSFEWRFSSDEEYSKTGSEVTHVYEEEGSYNIRLKTTYEGEDGSTETHETQKLIEVRSNTEPNIGAVQYDFNVDGSERKNTPVGSPVSAEVISGTCSVECGGAFNYNELDLPITSGVNMLVLDVDREGHTYTPLFYGTYDIENNYYASTDDISGDGLSQIRTDITEGSLTGANDALSSDISEYKGDNNYFIFVGGGNPYPLSSAVRTELSNLGSDVSTDMEKNSMWTFATQSLKNGESTPLHESYAPPDSNLDSISHYYTLEPIEISESTDAIPNRPIHLDLENSELTRGSLETAEIIWDYDSSTITNERYISIITDEDSTNDISATIVDELDFEGTSTKTISTKSTKPEPDIPDDISATVAVNNVLYPIGSYDKDSSIESYSWTVEHSDGESTYNGRNPSIMWGTSGTYDVTLQVEDRYGNTESKTKSIEVLGSPPSADAEINRVLSEFNTPDYNLDTPVVYEPILYYPFNLAEGVTKEYAQGLEEYSNNIQTGEGVTSEDNSIELSGDATIETPKEANKQLNHQFTISTWIKTDSEGTIYSTVDESVDNYISLRKWSDGPDFKIGSEGVESEGLDFDTDITDNTWHHITATYNSSEGMKLYVDGELEDETSSTVGKLNIDEKVTIGADSRGEFAAGKYTGYMSELQVYNAQLSESQIRKIESLEGESLIDVSQDGLLYDFGTEYNTISRDDSLSQGNYEIQDNDDHYYLRASSIDEVDSSAFVEISNVDLSLYDTIQMTYEAEFSKNILDTEMNTGYISIQTRDNPGEIEELDSLNQEGISSYVVEDYSEESNKGILELDVSSIDTEKSVYINAQSFGLNEGETELKIYELWGETDGEDMSPDTTEFNNEVYSDINSDTDIHKTRDGVRLHSTSELGNIRNVISIEDGASNININYDIHQKEFSSTDGLNLYADKNAEFEFGSMTTNPQSILCSPSPELSTTCEETGENQDNIRLSTDSYYNHIGIESILSNGYTKIDSLRITADTPSTNYPKVQFDGSSSEGAGTTVGINLYEWDINPEETFNVDSVGSVLTHEFDEIGTHEVKLRTTDTLGRKTTETFTVEVNSLEPRVEPTFTSSTDIDNPATFSVDTSTPGEATVEDIVWNMGNGDVKYGSEIAYTYENSGIYNVSVTVVSNNGLTESKTEIINVTDSDIDL